MATKVQRPKNGKPEKLGKLVVSAADAYLIGTAARLAGSPVYEYVNDRLIETVRADLESHGINPDRIPRSARGN